MDDRFQITPTPKQGLFITSNKRFTCYSGGFGNGKTTAGCLRSLILSGFPGNFGLIGRMTYPELRDTTRKAFFELCPPEYYDPEKGGVWKTSENYLRLTNGSEIIFRHLDQISEQELRSLNLGWFYIDQAEEIGEKVFMILQSRLRLPRVPNRFGFITCNPEPGSWIHKRFKKPLDEGTLPEDFDMIEASTYENKDNLPQDYIPSLIANFPEEMRKRYVDGLWEYFEGQIYPEFDRRVHVLSPFEIPKEWEHLISIDHGMVNPTAVLWGAIDYDSNIFIYDEYYQPGIVSQHARTILEKTGDQEISMWLIDPSTVARTREKDGMPWSVMEEYEDYGIYAIPANNERLAGINRVKEFLKIDPKRRHPKTGEVGSPRLFIFSNCVNLLTEIPMYQWKKLRSLTDRNAPEIPRDYMDHACFVADTLILTRRGEVPIENITVEDEVWTPLGWTQVRVQAKVGRKQVYDYGIFKATRDHPVFTPNGFLPLDSLDDEDSIMIWQDRKKLSGKEFLLGDTQIQKTGLIEPTLSTLLLRSMEARRDIYTERFGNFIMGRFPRGVKLIILTEIVPIILLITWNFLHTRNTPRDIIGAFMRVTKNIWRKLDFSQKNGMHQRREGFGTVSTGKKPGNIKVKLQGSVLLAEHSMGLFSLVEANTVVRNVTQKPSVRDVYNLQTRNGMYFANGVLVSNCDALKYMILSRFPAPLRRPTGYEMVLPIDRTNANVMTKPLPKDYEGDEMLGQLEGGLGVMQDVEDF